MRRFTLAALMITLALWLSACGGQSEARFEAFRQEMIAADEIRLTATVSADLVDTVRDYTLYFTWRDGEGLVEIIEPELIRGVRARIDGDSSKLEYDGIILDTGEFTQDAPTPLNALYMVLDAIRDGHIDSVWSEGEATVALIVPDDELRIELAVDSETGALRSADLISRADGRVLIRCAVSEFYLN